MIKTIRDDVIKLESYTAAAFKFDKELEAISGAGGYCFFIQLKIKYGESKAKKMVYEMERYKIIGTEYYSNYKYIYITQNASKYLANRNNTTKKIKHKEKNINKHPTQKSLLSSVLKYELQKQNISIWSRHEYINKLKKKIVGIFNYIEIPKNNLEHELSEYIEDSSKIIKLVKTIQPMTNKNNKKLIVLLNNILNIYQKKINQYNQKISNAAEQEKLTKLKLKKALNLYDISKIAVIPENKNKLNVYILDCGAVKLISKYLENIYDAEKNIGNTFIQIEITIISYSKERFEKFKKRFNKYKKENKLYTREIILKEITDCYFLQKIIEGSNYIDNDIKPKDKDAFNKIKKTIGEVK